MTKPRELYAPELWAKLHDQDPESYPALTVNDYKITKPLEIKAAFTAEFPSRIFISSLGFNVDNRRDGVKFDKDNVQSLIDLGVEPVTFKDADGVFHSLTIANLQTLRTEMIQDGLLLYQKKWTLESQIDAATTIAELEAIKW